MALAQAPSRDGTDAGPPRHIGDMAVLGLTVAGIVGSFTLTATMAIGLVLSALP